MAEHKQEVLAILCQTCLTCGEALKITETDRYREVRCPAEPVHYFRLESKRPGQPAGIFASETVSQV